MYASIVIGFSCLKLLLLPAYRSTDFEVHRNWLAITHSLPVDQWFTDETSQWTLDYPPLFAWFEFCLAKIAWYFDPEMLKVKNLNYASEMTILFQRLSVIVTDLVYAYGCKLCSEQVSHSLGKKDDSTKWLFLLLFGNAGLLMVDHIHFQYNGFLYGILFISIARLLQKREVESALWFSILLNLKHIYLYIAPVFFIYLLRSYTLNPIYKNGFKVKSVICAILRLAKLGLTVVFVFAVSFGPFVAKGQLLQVISRLFPFKRGLSHAYWAPNFWALYNFSDKILTIASTKLRVASLASNTTLSASTASTASTSSGLVQEFDHIILPSIPPSLTLLLTVSAITPSLVKLWRTPYESEFMRALSMCAFSSYMFGWHVHEKAILMVTLPLTLIQKYNQKYFRVFYILTTVGNFSLFPLFFTAHETPVKLAIFSLYTFYSVFYFECTSDHRRAYTSQRPTFPNINFGSLRSPFSSMVPSFLNIPEFLYMIGLIPVFLYGEILHKFLGFDESLPFLPLMIISVYCGLGITYCWLIFSISFIYTTNKAKKIQ